MTSSIKPYSDYKDSGLPWLDYIPTHWALKRGKNVFNCIDIRSTSGDEELLTVSSKSGVIPRRSAVVTMFKAESYTGYKLCWPDDLVINSLWAWANGLGVSKNHGIISSAYGVYRIKARDQIAPQFIHHLVRSKPFQWELQVRSKGIWTSRLQLTDESFLDAPLPIPPREEQTAIVRFIEYIDRHIKGFIRAKQKLIKLLNEQKQAIIHQAVTRGLDPNVRLKPSGVEWIEEIPEGWKIVRGKYIFHCIDIRSSTGNEELLTVSSERGIIPRSSANVTMFKAASYIGHKLCWPGDLVINSLWAWARGLGVSNKYGIVSTAYGVYRLRPEVEIDVLYLHELLRSSAFQWELQIRSKGIWKSRLQLTDESFLGAPILTPPLNEQIGIIKFIRESITELDKVIDTSWHEITLLQEYRTRIIADVVTGKLDVRSTAAQLPEELDVLEPTVEEFAQEDIIDEL